MMQKSLVVLLMLCISATAGLALPNQQQISGTLKSLPSLDTYDDTLYYDDNQIQWWYGGLTNFHLATRFTPLAQFEMQQILIAFIDSNLVTPVDLYLKNDDNGVPGSTIYWSGSLLYNMSTTWLPTYVDTNGTYMFSSGEDFWIEAVSVGPPYEMYDPSPVQPQRSLTMTGTSWFDSPGDNFIRAVGEYAGGFEDVGVDSVWHGENFFVTNGSSFQVGCEITNYGESAAFFQVGCLIYTEVDETTYIYFDSLAVQNGAATPGASTTVTFPAYTWNTNDRYRIDVRVYYTGDANPDNNIMSTETQVYSIPPAAELRYDDTQPDGAAYSSTVGLGWGMKFDPHQTGSYNINSIDVHASAGTPNEAARIQVLDDNGDAPGSVLWETVQVMTSGWNTFNVNMSNSGAFYVFYIFENGPNSAALSMDGYPGSGQAWERSAAGVFTPDPVADDWAMRATIGEAGAPGLWIDVTPTGTTSFGASGGTLEYNIAAGNSGTSTEVADIWIDVTLPNGSIFGPIVGPVQDFTFNPGFSTDRDRTANVPGGAPVGTYNLNGWIGDYDLGTIIAEDHFDFEKTAADGSSWNGWLVDTGEDFEDLGTGELLPAAFSLGQNYPNPFNPTTTIDFALPTDSYVNLSVYNVSGGLVATVVNGNRAAGNHSVTFDAGNLTSGVYFYKLTAGDYTAIAKMVLMK